MAAGAVALAKVPISVARALNPKGCPDLPSQCTPGTSLSWTSLLIPMTALRLFQIQCGSNSAVNIPALQADPVLARSCPRALPVVDLLAEVVEALVEFVELGFLPFDVGAVLLELAGQGVGARLRP